MTLVTVLSASGRPGLAQVRQLKKAGYEVRGTTRNPERLSQFDDIEVVSALITMIRTQFMKHV